MKKIKIALINPPLSGHKLRGTGTYAEELYKALKKQEEAEISLVNCGSNLTDFDAVHYPYFDPFFLTLPVLKRKPTIVTVHDLIPLKFQNKFPRGLRGEAKWLIQRTALQKTSRIITDSFASKEDIIQYGRISKEKIEVIYLGVREEFIVIKSEEILGKVRKKYNLPENFILHVGDVNYNKNIFGLTRAFSEVLKRNKDISLVLVGDGFINDSLQLRGILSLITHLGIVDKIKRLGYIDIFDLVAVYNLAKIYIQPSFAEGFGLPVLEAMACGCPTVVSNVSSLPEVAGEASVSVDPYSIHGIALGVWEMLNDTIKRKEKITQGFQRIRQFSWEKCARQTIEVYRWLLK